MRNRNTIAALLALSLATSIGAHAQGLPTTLVEPTVQACNGEDCSDWVSLAAGLEIVTCTDLWAAGFAITARDPQRSNRVTIKSPPGSITWYLVVAPGNVEPGHWHTFLSILQAPPRGREPDTEVAVLSYLPPDGTVPAKLWLTARRRGAAGHAVAMKDFAPPDVGQWLVKLQLKQGDLQRENAWVVTADGLSETIRIGDRVKPPASWTPHLVSGDTLWSVVGEGPDRPDREASLVELGGWEGRRLCWEHSDE